MVFSTRRRYIIVPSGTSWFFIKAAIFVIVIILAIVLINFTILQRSLNFLRIFSSNNYDNDHYHKQLTSQLQDAFVGGKPIDIRCLSAIALNWTTSSSSSSSSSSSFSSSSLLNSSSFKSPVDNLPSLPLEPPIYFDCLVNRHNLLSAVECATTAANTVPHQWALNTKGQLVKYEWRKEYLFIADPSFADHPEWICLRDSTTIKDVEKNYFNLGRLLKFEKCPQVTSNKTDFTGMFNFTVIGYYDFRKFRSKYYDREHVLLKKKRVLFVINSAHFPGLCLTCPRRQGGPADEDSLIYNTLTPCNLAVKEQLPTTQLFYLEQHAKNV